MAGKLRIDYGGAIYHVLNRGDRREPIFKTDRDHPPLPDTSAENYRKTGWKGEAQKLKMTRGLRQETTMTLQWIANRLQMGAAGFLANLSRGGATKAIICDCA
jgi:hypothetical protein